MGEARRKNKRQRGSRGTRCVATLWLLYAFLLLRAVPPRGPPKRAPMRRNSGPQGSRLGWVPSGEGGGFAVQVSLRLPRGPDSQARAVAVRRFCMSLELRAGLCMLKLGRHVPHGRLLPEGLNLSKSCYQQGGRHVTGSTLKPPAIQPFS